VISLADHCRAVSKALRDCYDGRHPVPTSELAECARIPEADARHALRQLQKERRVRRSTALGDECWEPW
jgi:RIO-like serine/threonine protein kinase